MLTYLTAGESHGKGILALVSGFPSGLMLDEEIINYELKRRQGGYGRGARQKIETDTVEILSGVWGNVSMGSPISLWVKNKDYRLPTLGDLNFPRPGHGDLSGSRKYLSSIRSILERASARETAGRVAAGALARQLLSLLGVEVFGFVKSIGNVAFSTLNASGEPARMESSQDISPLREYRDSTLFYSLGNSVQEQEARQLVDQAAISGDTYGGVVEIHVTGLPFGLGTHVQWCDKLDGLLAQAVMAVQSVKGVELGLGFLASELPGSRVHDPIMYNEKLKDTPCLGFTRPTNNAGGLEAGMTNTQPLVIRAAVKPISTLRQPLPSINLETHERTDASWERSDVCAVSAASVVVENVVAFQIASAVTEKFGSDSLEEIMARWSLFQRLAGEM